MNAFEDILVCNMCGKAPLLLNFIEGQSLMCLRLYVVQKSKRSSWRCGDCWGYYMREKWGCRARIDVENVEL